MKKFRKKILVFVLIILVGNLISKTYCFVIVNRFYHEINNFRETENRYYTVTIFEEKANFVKHEIFRKNSEIKYLQFDGNLKKIYLEFTNFDKNEKCFWMVDEEERKIWNQKEQYIMNRNFMVGIPRLMLKIYQNNKFNLKEFLNIYYVIPIKYENKKCYKIVTKYEMIIIDKETFLPKYSCKNWVNSEDDNACKMEYFYEFEINTVTEEDMQKL